MGRIKNTFALAKTSWHVLQKDRELLALPVLSFLGSLAALLVFALPGFFALDTSGATGEEYAVTPLSGILFILAGVSVAIVSVFFTGALVAGAHERMSGGDPTVTSAISRAFARIPGLVPWAIINWTVGAVIRALRERAGWVGNLILGGLQMGWEVAAFLTIPAIVIDDKGAIEGFKTSAGLLKKTWGENLIARVGFGLVGFLLIIPALLIGGALVASGSTALAIVGIATAVVWIALALVVMSALGAIFQTALYMYATTGQSPEGFENAGLAQSFGHK